MKKTLAEIEQIKRNLELCAQSNFDLKTFKKYFEELNEAFTGEDEATKQSNRINLRLIRIDPNFSMNGIRSALPIRFHQIDFKNKFELSNVNFSMGIEFIHCTFPNEVLFSQIEESTKIVIAHPSFDNSKISINSCRNSFELIESNKLEKISVEDCHSINLQVAFREQSDTEFKFENCKFQNQFNFPPHYFRAKVITISKCLFETALNLPSTAVHSKINIDECIFQKSLNFPIGRYEYDVSVLNSKLHGGVRLTKSEFLEEISVKNCEVGSRQSPKDTTFEINCQSALDFSESTFFGNANFSGMFKSTNLQRSRFLENLEMSGTFFGTINLRESVVDKYSSISGTTEDLDLTNFSSAKLDIQRSIINGSAYCTGSKVTSINLNSSKFHGRAIFDEAKFTSAIINAAEFSERTSFTATEFLLAPSFHGTTFFQDTNFHNSKFSDTESDGAEGAYRTLKQALSRMDNTSEEMTFSALELESRRKKIAKHIHWKKLSTFNNIPEWIFSWMYKTINNYGRSLIRPVFVWAFFLFLFSLIFSLKIDDSDLVVVNPKLTHKDIVGTWISDASKSRNWTSSGYELPITTKGLAFSALNGLGPLRLFDSYNLLSATNWFIQLLALAQGVISTILIYVFVIGVRRRFKTLS